MKVAISSRPGTLALAAWLILTGLVGLGVSFPYVGTVLAVLAVVAGVLVLLDK